jgi:hypothetical protein
MLRINSATKNLLVICSGGVKNIKQILHCVQHDSQCRGYVHFHSLWASVSSCVVKCLLRFCLRLCRAVPLR